MTQQETIAPEQDNSALPKIDVELDWEQYFHDFCEAHGKYPVVHNDDLLFPDGWRYSAYNHEGPEHAPPTNKNELDTLLTFYWERRYKIIRNEARDLEHFIEQLKVIQRAKDRPLLQRVTYKNDDGQYVMNAQPVNYKLLNQRLDWLKRDMLECQKQLKRISSA